MAPARENDVPHPTRVSMEVSNYLASWFISPIFWDLQPSYIGVIVQLLSTMAS